MGEYIRRTVRCGKVVEIEKYYAPRWGRKPGQRRGPNLTPTPEDVRRVNERNAVNRLRWLINANFGPGDMHAALTYRREDRPDVEEARRRLEKCLRLLRRAAKKTGGELRYIHATEYRRAAIHHHILLSGVTLAQLQAAWPWGRVHVTPLDRAGEYGTLAAYLVKETRASFADGNAPFAKRWCASRNLTQPEIRTEVIHAESWRRIPRAPRGYVLVPDSVEVGVHEVTGQPWQRYWMRRIE